MRTCLVQQKVGDVLRIEAKVLRVIYFIFPSVHLD